MKDLRRAFYLIILLVMLTGCGYSLAGRTSPLIQGRSVYPAMFANKTYQPNIEAEFRKALLDELALRGENVRLENEADLLISGELESGASNITAYSAIDTAKMYSFTLTATLQLVERKSGKVILKVTETMTQEYPATVNLGLQRNNLNAAKTELCVRMARIIVQKMDQAF